LNCWKTIPIDRRTARTCDALPRANSTPATRTEPPVGQTSPFRTRSSVDFPDPEGPISAVKWRAWTSRLTSRRAAAPLG